MSPKTESQKSPKRAAAARKRGSTGGFTDEERAAVREWARERKAQARGVKNAADGEAEVVTKIAEMPAHDRVIAEKIHAIVKETAPDLMSRTWYGMPAYAKEGKVICFFQPSQKFKTRYSTLGFSAGANLDEGCMWATSFAVKELTASEEARIAALVKQAVS